MKAQWKDYKYGSWLVLVFGQIDAKIVLLEGDPDSETAEWGIVMHPAMTIEITGPLSKAKKEAENMLLLCLGAGLVALNEATGRASFQTVPAVDVDPRRTS
jgi:hypothetical protein